MKLRHLLEPLDCVSQAAHPDTEITGIASHSRCVQKGNLFVALKGRRFDGHRFVSEAESAGAKAVVMEADSGVGRLSGEKIVVPDSRRALGILADCFWGHPSGKLRVIGITGTNGKTTTAYLIESIMRKAGRKTGVVGTINYRWQNREVPAGKTTPDPVELNAFLHTLVENSCSHCVMEVSSHALDQERVEGINFAAAIFTNLSQDHLDYHLNLEDYFQAKAKLFQNLAPEAYAVVNRDNRFGQKLLRLCRTEVLTYGLRDGGAEIWAENLSLGLTGSRFSVVTPRGNRTIETELIGAHNVSNILAAVAVTLKEKIDFQEITAGVRELRQVPGRLERIEEGQDFSVFVDYAHTPDALRKVLITLKEITNKNIVLVFGCGGDRDRSKRPLMGRVARELADRTILTSDNPRSEEPDEIIAQIKEGFGRDGSDCRVIPDRREAISAALTEARAGELVIIAGKGHENYQIFADRTIDFDDREAAREVLRGIVNDKIQMTKQF